MKKIVDASRIICQIARVASERRRQPQPTTTMKTTTNRNTLHSYAVEVMIDGRRTDIDVEAKNRRQAEAMVRKMGYEVRSVNMLS